MVNYIICDIDNCIADDAWRMKFIDWTPGLTGEERYARYHARCYGDVARNIDHLSAELWIRRAVPAFFTARPESMRCLTRGWLGNVSMLNRPFNTIEPFIMMNDAIDFVPSVPLKRQMLQRFRADLGASDRIVGAFDDREDIVAMYRAEGIFNAQVMKIHDVCPYTNPLTREKIYG